MNRWALIIALVLNAYLLGAMVMFAAVTYPQFGSVDRAAFPPLYQSFNSRIGVAVVPWEFIAFLTTLVLYVFRDELQLNVLHVVVALGVAYFASARASAARGSRQLGPQRAADLAVGAHGGAGAASRAAGVDAQTAGGGVGLNIGPDVGNTARPADGFTSNANEM